MNANKTPATPVFKRFAGKTIYMIMPDRFAIGQGKTAAQKLAEPPYRRWGVQPKAWHERPNSPSLGNDYFGGDLQGIIDRLDHLQTLGVDLIYLTPIFRAPSNHKYDTVDFMRIDPMFGDMATLIRLIGELKQRGMELIMDAVLNHVGDNHAWFRSARRGHKSADYFYFGANGDYACWWDFKHLPELNIEHDDLRDYFYRSTDSVLKYYLDLGVAGWRFDAAPDLGLDYVRDVRTELQVTHPDSLLIGELTCFASEWVQPSQFHGSLNYFMRDAVLHWLRGTVDARQLTLMIQRYCDEFGPEAACLSWNILSSHDQPRLSYVFPDFALRALAIALQFTLPGSPAIFYGEEIALAGGPEPDCRCTMPWDEAAAWNMNEFSLYQHLIQLRKLRRELREGALLMLGDQFDDAEFMGYIRHTEVPDEYSIILINSSRSPMRRWLFLPYSHIYDGVILEDQMNRTHRCRVMTGAIDISLPPQSVSILTPVSDQFSNFKFYKPRASARSLQHMRRKEST